ncbi:MAG: hypothetical protein IJV62_04460 [Eggerthellaceae bacterium]|nr:hypothetical protein [Eggerthellaceae bacterium]
MNVIIENIRRLAKIETFLNTFAPTMIKASGPNYVAMILFSPTMLTPMVCAISIADIYKVARELAFSRDGTQMCMSINLKHRVFPLSNFSWDEVVQLPLWIYPEKLRDESYIAELCAYCASAQSSFDEAFIDNDVLVTAVEELIYTSFAWESA